MVGMLTSIAIDRGSIPSSVKIIFFKLKLVIDFSLLSSCAFKHRAKKCCPETESECSEMSTCWSSTKKASSPTRQIVNCFHYHMALELLIWCYTTIATRSLTRQRTRCAFRRLVLHYSNSFIDYMIC